MTAQDRAEVDKFKVYLKRRATLPDEPIDLAYAEVYGEVVFEDKSEIE
jgi:hypothetical protein